MSNRYKWLILIIGCALSFLLIANYNGRRAILECEGTVVTHRAIIRELRAYLDAEGKLPEDIPELCVSESAKKGPHKGDLPWLWKEVESHALEYYPEAWNKQGQVLLHSRVCGSYVLTFGDGSHAIVTEYYEHKSELIDPNKESVYGRELRLRRIPTPVGRLVFPSLIVLVIALLLEWVVRKRGSRSSQRAQKADSSP